MTATYFWSGSNRAGEIAALAKHGLGIGVAVHALDVGGRGMAALLALAGHQRIEVNVARARGGRPILMFSRGERRFSGMPEGDVEVDVAGRSLLVGFRKIAANVARTTADAPNVLGRLLRGLFGEDAGTRGHGHRVVIERSDAGWRMTAAELGGRARRPSPVFVDSGAFSEVRWCPDVGALVDDKPIDDAQWHERLDAYDRLADALGDRVHLVAPDKVGDQDETLRRLARYAPRVRGMRALGARIIVPIQRGRLSGADFDRRCAEVLGFDDYVRGIPSKKAAATVDEIAALSRELPAGARVHLLGLGPWGKRYHEVIAAIARDPRLVSCDSVRIKALVGWTNGRGGGPRILTALTAAVKRALGWVGRTLSEAEADRVKYESLDRYLSGETVGA